MPMKEHHMAVRNHKPSLTAGPKYEAKAPTEGSKTQRRKQRFAAHTATTRGMK